jgi:hypothetical protein
VTVDEESGDGGDHKQAGFLGPPVSHRDTASFGLNDADVRPKRVEGASLENPAIGWQSSTLFQYWD